MTALRSLLAAFAFLTVLPVGHAAGAPGERLGRAYFPAVGAVVGLGAALAFVGARAVTTPLVAAVTAVAVLAVLTGALHLDGLADSADGLFGGHDRERRLEIMRDPRIGAFGVVAVVVALLGEVALLSALPPLRAGVALIVAGALSRWALLGAVVLLPYARVQGLGSAAQGRHRVADLALGSGLAAAACLLDWRRALLALLLVAVAAAAIGRLAQRRLGGATGDIYGATVEVCQLAALTAFALRR